MKSGTGGNGPMSWCTGIWICWVVQRDWPKHLGLLPAARALDKSEALGTEILLEYDIREFAVQGEKGMYNPQLFLPHPTSGL